MKKRLALSLALLAGLVMGATSANAADIKAAGSWKIDAGWSGHNYFGANTNLNRDQKTFSIDQRIRTAFQFIANENLKGVMEIQFGPAAWGNDGLAVTQNGGGATNGNGNIKVRKAYVDFNWPGTKNRFLVGHQSLSLPSTFGGGSAILDHHFSAAAAIVPVTDNISLVGGYARLLDDDGNGYVATTNGNGSSIDAAFLYSDLKFTGFNIQPFAAFAYGGANAINGSNLVGMLAPNGSGADGIRSYWAGAAFTMTALDPFKVTADLNYGKATNNNGNTVDGGRSGWLGDIAVDYTGLSMMTPSLFFAYTSGEDDDAGKSERMPVVAAQNWAVGSFFMQNGNIGAAINTNNTPATALGFWAAGLSLKDIKLIDKLSHSFHVIYFKGNNDEANVGRANFGTYGQVLTEKDSLWEVDLNSTYKIYEELALGLELGYIFNNYDKDVWAASANDRDNIDKNAYKAVLEVTYSF
ncbi:MAG: outer membrane homotrimeric porin [Desulfovibrio sp.]